MIHSYNTIPGSKVQVDANQPGISELRSVKNLALKNKVDDFCGKTPKNDL